MKKFFIRFKPLIYCILCFAVCIAFLCTAFKTNSSKARAEESVITVWQVDSFEGGKGSRADFLQKTGQLFSQKENCFVTVLSLSADAVRQNLNSGIFPDLISYGAGAYGLESYISGHSVWCHGGYCLLTLDGDFTDVNCDNTIINEGKDNLAGGAAMFCGLQNAKTEKPTGAYVKLLNGGYKYLLGTQRDIYRLKTRGASFKIQPITEFNDLYQNISVVPKGGHLAVAEKFIACLLKRAGEVSSLGLMSDKATFDDEMNIMQNLDYRYKLTSPVSEQTAKSIKQAISASDINILKNLLK